MTGVTSSPPPRQLSVSDLFTYQRPRQSQRRSPTVTAALPDQQRLTVNMAANMARAHHVTLSYWPEPEIEYPEQRRTHRLPATSSSFDDSAIDNQSAPSTSSGGSRGRSGGSRINQSATITRSSGSHCHDLNNGDASGHHVTRSVAVIPCLPCDVTPELITLQTNMAALRQGEDQVRRSRDPATSTRHTDRVTVYKT